MTDLFERVLHHLEGRETEIQNWETPDGIKPVEFQSFGPDRWIESVHENGRLMAVDCLALVLFVVDSSFDKDARRVVEGWAAELRKAVSAGEIHARDPNTLLALEALPDGWEWLLSVADADKFVAARGMDWRFGEVASHLFNELEQDIQNRRFPPWTRTAPAQDTATPAPVAVVASVALPKQRAQEQKILELLKNQGYDPLKLEKRMPGKPGPKVEIRTLALNQRELFTNNSFDKAWERLRSEGAVAGAD